jgi:hypothetical protein
MCSECISASVIVKHSGIPLQRPLYYAVARMWTHLDKVAVCDKSRDGNDDIDAPRRADRYSNHFVNPINCRVLELAAELKDVLANG